MSLLDTFTILFDADTGSLPADLKRSGKSSDDLVDSLKDADKAGAKAGNSFASFAAKATGALAAALGISNSISGTISKAADIAQIGQTSEALNVAVEDLDAFGRAAQNMGGDAQGARDSITDMSESIGEALQDVESMRAKTFAGLGVSLKDLEGNTINGIEGILRLSDAVQDLSKEEAVFRIKELGITDNRTVEMVLKGRKELERLLETQKQSGVITKQQAEEAQKFTEVMGKLRGALDSTGTGFMSSLIPALTKAVEWLTKLVEWAGRHSDLIVGFFMAVAAAVTYLYLPAMIAAATATLAATWPLIAIAGVITAVAAAFALAYDDVMAFIDGNDSFIGQIFGKYPMVKDIVMSIIEVFKYMGQVIIEVFGFIGKAWKAQFDFIMNGVNMVKSGVSSVADFFGVGGDNDVKKGQSAVDQANRAALNAATSGAISNMNKSTSNSLSISELTIQTQSTDSDGISRDIRGSLDEQLSQMQNEFASGVDR